MSKDKLSKIYINGTGLTESGKEISTKFFKTLAKDLDDYSNISFTREEAIKVNNHLSKLQTGSTAVVPLICGGREICPFADRCVFAQMDKCPTGLQCLLEVGMIKNWVFQYMKEYEVDPENFTEVGFCNELPRFW
jgi:hypothetical protein